MVFRYILIHTMFLLKVGQAFDANKVRYAIAGGYAVNLHGAVRGTLDIDVLIPLTEHAFRRAESALRSLGLKSRLPVSAAEVFRFRREYIEKRNLIAWSFLNPDVPTEIVDIVITHDLRKCKITCMRFNGRKIPVVALADLIRMKRASNREQDKADVEALKIIASERRKNR